MQFKLEVMTAKEKLTLGERIDRARVSEGRTQTWIIARMNEKGFDTINDTTFSRKKKGHEEFSEQELSALSKILNTDLSK